MGTQRIRTCRALRTRRRTRATWTAARAGVTCPPRPAIPTQRATPAADATTDAVADERELAMVPVRPASSDL